MELKVELVKGTKPTTLRGLRNKAIELDNQLYEARKEMGKAYDKPHSYSEHQGNTNSGYTKRKFHKTGKKHHDHNNNNNRYTLNRNYRPQHFNFNGNRNNSNYYGPRPMDLDATKRGQLVKPQEIAATNDRNNKRDKKCYICGRLDHYSKDCYRNKGKDRKDDHKGRSMQGRSQTLAMTWSPQILSTDSTKNSDELIDIEDLIDFEIEDETIDTNSSLDDGGTSFSNKNAEDDGNTWGETEKQETSSGDKSKASTCTISRQYPEEMEDIYSDKRKK